MCLPAFGSAGTRSALQEGEAPGGRLRHWERAAVELRLVHRGAARIPLRWNPSRASTSKVPRRNTQEPGSAATRMKQAAKKEDKILSVENVDSRAPSSGFNIADSTELIAINDLAKESNESRCSAYDKTNINTSTLNKMGFITNFHDTSHLKPSSKFNPPLPNGNLIDTFHELVIGDIDKFRMKVPSKTTNRSNFTQQDWKDLNVLRTNTSIIIKPSDKGGNIAIMDIRDYTKEAYRQLMNIDHYDKLRTNPIIQYQVTYHEMLKEWHIKQLIDYDEFTYLKIDYPKIPCIYFLPKIHKNKSHPPGRPIVNLFILLDFFLL
ncbi:hypothetical protein NDU88_005757 [Pleurodeles waltl]|uniref:Uncharacterized protein n=1 Tax=Pleurodeles waltl TaxID=8319 RepID=A0AAV7RLX7_PLEWA|nr:hypothetical protein NDU88_005757 [Pleurodeles waltl]